MQGQVVMAVAPRLYENGIYCDKRLGEGECGGGAEGVKIKQKPLIDQGFCASMTFSDYFNWLHDQDSNLEPSG